MGAVTLIHSTYMSSNDLHNRGSLRRKSGEAITSVHGLPNVVNTRLMASAMATTRAALCSCTRSR